MEESYVRVFFCSRRAPDADGKYLSFISYVDLDKEDLRKVLRVSDHPVLNLGRRGTFDEFGTNPVSVIKYRNEIRAYYAGWTRCESVPFNAAIGLAISRDGGQTFNRLGDGPVLSYSPDEPFLLGSPRVRRFQGRWQMWYVAGQEWRKVGDRPEPIYKIRMAVSEDGISWIKQGRNLIANVLGERECQACPDVTFRDGRYHMFFSYRDIFDYSKGKGGYRIGYASSSDMHNWRRNDELVEMHRSGDKWDSEMISYPHVIQVRDSTYMFYQGNGMGREGFGLAILRRS